MTDLLHSIIITSTKAANIAKACRKEPALFKLLIQEKSPTEGNPRFVQDFKTLADVLIQETVRHDLSKKFPEIADHIFGEECNVFCNTLGETITVEIKESQDDTAELLSIVLNGDIEAASLLAEEIYKEIAIDDVNAQISGCLNFDIPIDNLSIWIDPIDSTAEYINGKEDEDVTDDISLSGLQCVTVLIGVFDRVTGKPVMGVINQPFYNQSKGRCLWGISYMGRRIYFNPLKENNQKDTNTPPSICISANESEELKNVLRSSGYKLIETAGAGYKLLMVILGYVDAYVLSKPSTYKWDTCGPHAILNALKGGILDFSKLSKPEIIADECEILYSTDDYQECGDESLIKKFCNKGGILAYRNDEIVENLLGVLF